MLVSHCTKLVAFRLIGVSLMSNLEAGGGFRKLLTGVAHGLSRMIPRGLCCWERTLQRCVGTVHAALVPARGHSVGGGGADGTGAAGAADQARG